MNYPNPIIDAEFTEIGVESGKPEEPAPREILKDSDEWAARLPKPLTFGNAKTFIEEPIRYAVEVYNRTVGLSTQPPMSLIAPNMAEAIKEALKIRDGLNVLLKKGANPDTRFSEKFESKLSQRMVEIGSKVYQAVFAFVSDTNKTHNKIANWVPGLQKKNDDSIPFWKIAAGAALGIAAVVAVKDLIDTVKH